MGFLGVFFAWKGQCIFFGERGLVAAKYSGLEGGATFHILYFFTQMMRENVLQYVVLLGKKFDIAFFDRTWCTVL